MQNLKPYQFLMMQLVVGVITGIITSMIYDEMCRHARIHKYRSQLKSQ